MDQNKLRNPDFIVLNKREVCLKSIPIIVLSLSAKPAHSHGRFMHPKLSFIYPALYPLLSMLYKLAYET